MVQPPFLKPNDKVAVIGVAGKVNKKSILRAGKVLENWGLKLVFGQHLFDNHFRFSSSLENRAKDFQSAIDDPEIKAIFLARGGYGSSQIIDLINWNSFHRSPKWIIGFSDITVLLMHINTLGCMSLHATMPSSFSKKSNENSVNHLRSILFGENIEIISKPNPYNIYGEASAEIIGGNLSVLCSLIGTSSDISFDDKILLLEEIAEPLYKIDRMMVHLYRSGKLKNITGLVVGHFTEMEDDADNPYGQSVEEIIKQYVLKDIPVMFDATIGHDLENYPIILGKNYHLEVNSKGSSLVC